MENPHVADLLDRMAWLTADAITIMSTRYLIRQNCFSRYDVHERVDDGALVLQSHTATNFSSFGQLYAILIAIDLTLLALNCCSSLELIQWMSFPKYSDVKSWAEQQESAEGLTRTNATRHLEDPPPASFVFRVKQRLAAYRSRVQHADHDRTSPVMPISVGTSSPSSPPKPDPRLTRIQRRRRLLATMEAMGGVTAIEEEQLYSFVSRSLYRNPRIVLMTITTQLISWLLVLPNAVVWTWSDSTHEKLQAYLSSIRCWVLLLILSNTLWSGVVRVSERTAYAITKRTFLTSIDMIGIASFVSFVLRSYVFSMSEEKWHVEGQRVTDVTSFTGGYLAHANTFNGALDSIDMTPLDIFTILYGPLVRILLTSVGAVIVLLGIKAAYFSQQRRDMVRRTQRRVTKQIVRLSRRLSKESNSSALDGSGPVTGASRIDSTGFSDTDASDDNDDIAEREKALLLALREPYQRLPLEEWMDQPIRATSLVRNGLRMETVRDATRFIRPSCYLDFGIIVKRGVIHSRIGFSDSWKPKMTVQEYMTRVEHQAPAVEALADAAVGPTDGGLTRRPRLDRANSNSRMSSHADLKRKQSLHIPLS